MTVRYVGWNLSVTSRALFGALAVLWVVLAAALRLVGDDLATDLIFGFGILGILASFGAALPVIAFWSKRLRIEVSSGTISIYGFVGCTRIQLEAICEIIPTFTWFLPGPALAVKWVQDGMTAVTSIYAMPFGRIDTLLRTLPKPSV
jgi:hypothetical protein